MERTKKRWAVTSGGLAAATVTAVVLLAGPAAATDGSTSGSSSTSSAPSSAAPGSAAPAGTSAKPKYCEHIDKALERRQKVADRWNGDASQRGSIAWLQARAAKVGSSDPQLAKLLTDEAARRSQDKDPAATIVADLQALQQTRCS